MEEDKVENDDVKRDFFEADSTSSESNPFEKLREEAEVERLKIASYFKGKTEFEKEDRPKVRPSSKVAKVPEIEERSDQVEPRIPLIDKYAQGALRRRVVHDQLDRVLPDVLQLLGILRRDINDQLNKLVFSFSLSAENIILKPEEWTLVAIILIKMVARQDSNTRKCLATQSSVKYLNMLLLSYAADPRMLDAKIEGFHSSIHGLLVKMKSQTTTTTG